MQRLLILAVVTAVGVPAAMLPRTVRALMLHVAAGRRGAVLIALGLAAGAIGYAALANRSSRFWRVLHHEVAHAVVALLMLARPSSLVVEGGAGHIKYDMSGPLVGVRSFFIGIAPYCISPVALLSGVLLLLVPDRETWFVVAMAGATGVGLAATLLEFSPRQPDLGNRGVVFASACALWIWCASVVVLLQCLSSPAPFATLANTYHLAGGEFIGWVRMIAEKSWLIYAP